MAFPLATLTTVLARQCLGTGHGIRALHILKDINLYSCMVQASIVDAAEVRASGSKGIEVEEPVGKGSLCLGSVAICT